MRYKDYLKWLGSRDTSRARRAAQGTTSAGMTTGGPSATAATTPNPPTSSYSLQQRVTKERARINQFLMEEYLTIFQNEYRDLFNKSTESQFHNYYEQGAGGMISSSNFASPTETSTENLSVFKDVTTAPKGQLKPST